MSNKRRRADRPERRKRRAVVEEEVAAFQIISLSFPFSSLGQQEDVYWGYVIISGSGRFLLATPWQVMQPGREARKWGIFPLNSCGWITTCPLAAITNPPFSCTKMETLEHSPIHSGTKAVCAFVTGFYAVGWSSLCVYVCVCARRMWVWMYNRLARLFFLHLRINELQLFRNFQDVKNSRCHYATRSRCHCTFILLKHVSFSDRARTE